MKCSNKHVLYTQCLNGTTSHESLKKNSPQKYRFNKSAELGYCIAFWLDILC